MATIQSNINQLLALTAAGAYGARRLQQESYAAEDLAEQAKIKGIAAAQRGRADANIARIEADDYYSDYEKEVMKGEVEAGQGAVKKEAGRIAQERAELAASRPHSIIGAARARKEAGALSGEEVEERLEIAKTKQEIAQAKQIAREEKKAFETEAEETAKTEETMNKFLSKLEQKKKEAEEKRNAAIRVKAEQEAARQDFFNLIKSGKALVDPSGKPYISEEKAKTETGLSRDQLLEMYRKSIKGGN